MSSPFFFSLPPSRNSDPGTHSRLFSPLPTTVRALHCYREKISALSSLVNLRRTVLTHAINRRSQQLLVLFLFFSKINSKSHHGGIRTHGPTLLIVYIAFEGYHETTGATGRVHHVFNIKLHISLVIDYQGSWHKPLTALNYSISVSWFCCLLYTSDAADE